MNRKLIILLLLLVPFISQAQLATIDSLQQALKQEEKDTSRVLLLNALSRNYVYSRPDTALLLGQRALILARNTNFAKGEALSLSRIAVVFWITGNYPKALQLSLEALKKAEAAKDQRLILKIISNLGGTYSTQGDYPQALTYLRKCLTLAKSQKDETSVLVSLINIGDVYEKLNLLDSALFYINKGYEEAIKQKDEQAKSFALNNFGNIYSKKGSNILAMQNYRLALPYYNQEEDFEGLAEVYLGIAGLFQKENKQDSCVFYAKKSLRMAHKGGFTEKVMKASNFLTNYYKAIPNIDSAFVYQSATIAAKDSLFNQEKAREIQNLSYEETMRQQQILDAQEEAKTQQKFNMLFGGLFTLILVAFLLYRNNRQKQKTNALLTRQKAKVESTLQELKITQDRLVQSAKMASLGELTAGIAHEIQNPLNFVNNFSEVSAELLLELDEELQKGDTAEALIIAADVKENLLKINHHGMRAASIVKSMLQHSGSNSAKKEATDINALTEEYLRLSYHGLRAKDKNFNASLVFNGDSRISKLNVVPQEIGRVLLNLFNNAFYAVQQKKSLLNGQYQPEVKVSTYQQNGKLQIKIRDNGTGIPESVKQKIFQPFFTTKPTGKGTGLGLSLSYDILTKGHHGELQVESEEGEFTEFTITLPYSSVPIAN